jgi:hypothetical protein
MSPSTLIQSVVFKPSKRKDVFYEMSSACPVCKLKCSRKDVMLRHKRNKHGTTHPYSQSSDAYPQLREGYTPPPPATPAAATTTSSSRRRRWERDIRHSRRRHRRRWERNIRHSRRHRRSSHAHRVMKKNLIIFWKPTILTHFTFQTDTIPIISCRGSIHLRCNLRTNRKWKIRLCQEIRTQYQTHDDPNTGSHLVVLWRIPDFIRNCRWSGISTRIAGLGHPRPQRKTFNNPGRSHGRNGSKSSFSVYEEESPQKHQCHVHRSESVSSRKTP